jgi:hypothetical protein
MEKNSHYQFAITTTDNTFNQHSHDSADFSRILRRLGVSDKPECVQTLWCSPLGLATSRVPLSSRDGKYSKPI